MRQPPVTANRAGSWKQRKSVAIAVFVCEVSELLAVANGLRMARVRGVI